MRVVVVEMCQLAIVGEFGWLVQAALECVRRRVLSVWWEKKVFGVAVIIIVSGDLDQRKGEGEIRLSWLLTAAMRGGQSSRVRVWCKNEETDEKKGSGTRNKEIKHYTPTPMIWSIREQTIHYCTQQTRSKPKKKTNAQTDRTERVRETDRGTESTSICYDPTLIFFFLYFIGFV